MPLVVPRPDGEAGRVCLQNRPQEKSEVSLCRCRRLEATESLSVLPAPVPLARGCCLACRRWSECGENQLARESPSHGDFHFRESNYGDLPSDSQKTQPQYDHRGEPATSSIH